MSGEKSYWKCEESHSTCKARLHLKVENNRVLKLIGEHSHFPIPGRKVVLDTIHGMKEDARLRPQKRPREIIGAIGDLHDLQQAQMSSLSAKTQMVQRIKRVAVDSIPIPKSRDFDLPSKFEYLEDNETPMLKIHEESFCLRLTRPSAI